MKVQNVNITQNKNNHSNVRNIGFGTAIPLRVKVDGVETQDIFEIMEAANKFIRILSKNSDHFKSESMITQTAKKVSDYKPPRYHDEENPDIVGIHVSEKMKYLLTGEDFVAFLKEKIRIWNSECDTPEPINPKEITSALDAKVQKILNESNSLIEGDEQIVLYATKSPPLKGKKATYGLLSKFRLFDLMGKSGKPDLKVKLTLDDAKFERGK